MLHKVNDTANKRRIANQLLRGSRSVLEDLRAGVQQGRMAMINQHLPVTLLISNFVGLGFIAYAASSQWSNWLFAWGAALLTLALLSINDLRAVRPSIQPREHRSKRRLYHGLSRVMLLGGIWGALTLFMPHAPIEMRLAILLAVGGVGSAGAVLLCAIPLFATVFILLVMVPPAIFMLLSGEEPFSGLVWVWLIYMFALCTSSIMMQGAIFDRQRAKEFSNLFEVLQTEKWLARQINDADSLSEAVQRCLDLVIAQFEFQLGHLFLQQGRDPANPFTSYRVWADRSNGEFRSFIELSEAISFRPNEYYVGEVIANGVTQTLYLEEVLNVPGDDLPPRALSAAEVGIHRAIMTPIFSGDRVVGVVELWDNRSEALPPEAILLAELVGLQFGRAIEREQMNEQRQFLLCVLENIDDEIVACDADGQLYYNDDPAVLDKGFLAPVPAQQWASTFSLLHADGITPLRTEEIPLYRAWQGERIKNVEMVSIREGAARRFVTSGGPMHDADGNLVGGVLTMRDVSDMRNLQNQLLHANKMEAVGQLTGGIAHDFNNILMVAQGNLELLKASFDLDEEASELLERSVAAIDNATGVTHQLLTVSKRQALRPDSVDIASCITDLTSMLGRTLGPGIELQVDQPSDLWLVHIDPSLLESALLNLAINARDAMQGEGTLAITSANATLGNEQADALSVYAGEYVEICVSDTGSGMSPDLITRIFEPFFTTKEASKGTGLGLSMVHGFIQQSGGGINVQSTVGEGTGISLYLPRAGYGLGWDDGIAEPADSGPTKSDSADQNVATILVIEDEDSLLRFICKVLSQHNYHVFEANGDVAAIEQIEQHGRFDLVISDIMLRGSANGFELASRIDTLSPGQTFLFMTGFADLQNLNIDQKWQHADLLNKPFGIATLLENVQRAVTESGQSLE